MHQHSIDGEHLWRPCTRPLTPRIQRTSIYTMRGATAALLAGWIIYDEAYADQLTASKLHYISDGYTLACQPQPSSTMKGLHTQSSWSNRDSMRCRVLVLWSNNASDVDIETKEDTRLIERWTNRNRCGKWEDVHQYTLIKIPYTIGYVEMNKMMLLLATALICLAVGMNDVSVCGKRYDDIRW